MKYSIKTLVLCKTHNTHTCTHTHTHRERERESSMVHINNSWIINLDITIWLNSDITTQCQTFSMHIRQFWHLSLMPMAQTCNEQNFKVVKCVNWQNKQKKTAVLAPPRVVNLRITVCRNHPHKGGRTDLQPSFRTCNRTCYWLPPHLSPPTPYICPACGAPLILKLNHIHLNLHLLPTHLSSIPYYPI